MLQQRPHEGPLLKVLDQALADEVVEVGAPVGGSLQRRRRVSRNLATATHRRYNKRSKSFMDYMVAARTFAKKDSLKLASESTH